MFKILLLGSNSDYQKDILDFLERKNNKVKFYSKKISADDTKLNEFDFLISFGYRYIISEAVLNKFKPNAINLHISYLPWNRGADPNLWSFIEDTPKGVTIHEIDEGIDTGDIIFQKEIVLNTNETLASSYEKLQSEIVKLFKENWFKIVSNDFKRLKQSGRGSFHSISDGRKFLQSLPLGWNTKVSDIKGLVSNVQNR